MQRFPILVQLRGISISLLILRVLSSYYILWFPLDLSVFISGGTISPLQNKIGFIYK